MIPSKVWVPAHEVKGGYAFMMEMRDGVRWVLVRVASLTEEQKLKYGVNP